jgi:hypothetical protein
VGSLVAIVAIPDPQAIPAFARKYGANGTVCHTRVPRCIWTEEYGGIIKKSLLGDPTPDDVTNYLGFRPRGNLLRTVDYAHRVPGTNIDGNPENRTELGSPEVFSVFTTGPSTNKVRFFVEVESNLEEDGTGIERVFLIFNNLLDNPTKQWHLGAHSRWFVSPQEPSSCSSTKLPENSSRQEST